jgi:hypothetical protein
MTRSIFFQFLIWYFWETPKNILLAWKNYLKFNLEFFSTPLLLKTLFAPWRQYKWDYGRGFDLLKYLEIFFSNLITRTIGMFMRSILIILGLVAEVVIFIVGLIIFLGWFALLPFLIFGLGFALKLL